MNLETGSSIGDYQVVGILGAGGMGKVYKVRNTISDRVEAMKVLLPDLANAPDLADRFLREIKVHASLEHPNIAALHTALRVENQLLMLMEFVEGVTLEQKLQGGPLDPAQAADYVSQALAALDYAHRNGEIHRDIKPANMMLTPSGVVKLMDFGIAKAASDRRLTMTGTTMGSLYYMSPEQIQAAANIDARSDLYSLGVSLYELATGKRPFDGDSQFSIMSAHLEKTPVPPVEIDPRLPRDLNDIILMSVAKDPAMRFQTAGAFRAALGNAMPEAPAAPKEPMGALAAARPAPPVITQPPAPAPAQFQPLAPAPAAGPKSKRGLWMALGALAAALGAMAMIEIGSWKETKAQTQPAAQANAAPAPAPQASAPQSAPAPAQTPQPAAAAPDPVESAPARQSIAKPATKSIVKTQKALADAPAPVQTATPPPAQPQPVEPPPQTQPRTQPANPAPAPAQAAAAAPNRAELQAARERLVQLNVRAAGIRSTLQSMQRAQAASGLNLSARFTGPAGLMDSYLQGAADALRDSDTASTKDFMDKAERNIETLEKLLNR